MRTWMVRAGKHGVFFDDFRERELVGIGWPGIGSLGEAGSREEVADLVRNTFPLMPDQAVVTTSAQLFRFVHDFAKGDRVITYDPRARSYLCGTITGDYHYSPQEEFSEFFNQRKVQWHHEVSRDEIPDDARNTLGSTLTIFSIPAEISAILWTGTGLESRAPGETALVPKPSSNAEETADGMSQRASEIIKDRISRFSWEQLQELVAGILRAMGYKTRVSAVGPDRGKDIIASPDGFGFRDPRIVVEVKHRPTERMGAREIRGLLGGGHENAKGLFVSTGGFTKEAYYEAERGTIPVALMDFELLVETILDHYASFDEDTKRLLPLRRIYWPDDV